jgi:hypothetical protein
MVPTAGLEPARHYCRGILSPLRLPVPPSGPLRRQFIRIGYKISSIAHFDKRIFTKNRFLSGRETKET